MVLLHDLSDVPLDLMKMANYLCIDGDSKFGDGLGGMFITEIMYVVNMVSWVSYSPAALRSRRTDGASPVQAFWRLYVFAPAAAPAGRALHASG